MPVCTRSQSLVSATPLPEFADDGKPLALSLSSSVASGSSKPRLSSLPLNSGAPSSARSSVDPRGEEKDKKKKKKRKRELLEESDVEMGMSRSMDLNINLITLRRFSAGS